MIAAELERAEAAKSSAARTKQRNEPARRLRAFLERLRRFTVLDPACGSGNFLYLALQALKDLEHRVQLEAEALGFQRAFPETLALENVRLTGDLQRARIEHAEESARREELQDSLEEPRKPCTTGTRWWRRVERSIGSSPSRATRRAT